MMIEAIRCCVSDLTCT